MTNVQQYEMKDLNGIGIYVGTYAKYAAGSIFGTWLDMGKFADAEEFFDVCRELHCDEDDPEFMFQDFQGFPEGWYSECMGEGTIQKIIDYAKLTEDEREMLDDYTEYAGDDATFEEARDNCLGKYDSEEDYCEQYAEECMNIPDGLKFYIDYKAMARDFFMDLYMGSNGYVFTR